MSRGVVRLGCLRRFSIKSQVLLVVSDWEPYLGSLVSLCNSWVIVLSLCCSHQIGSVTWFFLFNCFGREENERHSPCGDGAKYINTVGPWDWAGQHDSVCLEGKGV